jgi:hypothetical protein
MKTTFDIRRGLASRMATATCSTISPVSDVSLRKRDTIVPTAA